MDLISRQAAIDAIKRCESSWSYGINTGVIMAMNAVADVPTIDPVKHGKWVLPRSEGCVTYDERAYAECSICGKKSFLGWSDKYCRNCGAQMERGEDE